jgi:hypothetical protein
VVGTTHEENSQRTVQLFRPWETEMRESIVPLIPERNVSHHSGKQILKLWTLAAGFSDWTRTKAPGFQRRIGGDFRLSKLTSKCPVHENPLLSYELNRQRNNRINGCNCRGIAVMFVQCTMRTDDNVK